MISFKLYDVSYHLIDALLQNSVLFPLLSFGCEEAASRSILLKTGDETVSVKLIISK